MKKTFIFLFFISTTIYAELFSQDLEDEIIITSSKLINNQLLGGSTNIISKEEIFYS